MQGSSVAKTTLLGARASCPQRGRRPAVVLRRGQAMPPHGARGGQDSRDPGKGRPSRAVVPGKATVCPARTCGRCVRDACPARVRCGAPSRPHVGRRPSPVVVLKSLSKMPALARESVLAERFPWERGQSRRARGPMAHSVGSSGQAVAPAWGKRGMPAIPGKAHERERLWPCGARASRPHVGRWPTGRGSSGQAVRTLAWRRSRGMPAMPTLSKGAEHEHVVPGERSGRPARTWADGPPRGFIQPRTPDALHHPRESVHAVAARARGSVGVSRPQGGSMAQPVELHAQRVEVCRRRSQGTHASMRSGSSAGSAGVPPARGPMAHPWDLKRARCPRSQGKRPCGACSPTGSAGVPPARGPRWPTGVSKRAGMPALPGEEAVVVDDGEALPGEARSVPSSHVGRRPTRGFKRASLPPHGGSGGCPRSRRKAFHQRERVVPGSAGVPPARVVADDAHLVGSSGQDRPRSRREGVHAESLSLGARASKPARGPMAHPWVQVGADGLPGAGQPDERQLARESALFHGERGHPARHAGLDGPPDGFKRGKMPVEGPMVEKSSMRSGLSWERGSSRPHVQADGPPVGSSGQVCPQLPGKVVHAASGFYWERRVSRPHRGPMAHPWVRAGRSARRSQGPGVHAEPVSSGERGRPARTWCRWPTRGFERANAAPSWGQAGEMPDAPGRIASKLLSRQSRRLVVDERVPAASAGAHADVPRVRRCVRLLMRGILVVVDRSGLPRCERGRGSFRRHLRRSATPTGVRSCTTSASGSSVARCAHLVALRNPFRRRQLPAA